MNVLIVYAHPEPTSFSGALKDTAVKTLTEHNHHVEVIDLYKDNFNPVAGRHDFTTVLNPDRFHYQAEQEHASLNDGFSDEIKRYQDKVQQADLFVFVFPLWWGGMPAILKGWIDRVLAYGFAYVDGHRYETGLYKGRRGIICLPTGGSKRRFSPLEEGGAYGEIDQVLYPINHCIIKYFGLELMDPFVAYAAPRISDADRIEVLANWSRHVLEIVEDKEWKKKVLEIDKTNVKYNHMKEGWKLNH